MKKTFLFGLLTPLCLLSWGACSSDQPGTMDGSVGDFSTSRTDMGVGEGDMTTSIPDPTEVIVARVGDGANPLVANTVPVFLERHKIADGALVGTPIALPIAVSGANRRLTLSGTAFSEGALNRSEDGHYVLIAGYDTAVNTAFDSVNRVIGRMAADGSLDTSTSFDALNGAGNNVRSATSTDGTELWAAGVTGVIYTTLGSTAMPTQLLGSTFNMRVLGIIDGQLYTSRSSATAGGINRIGTGTPMATNTTATQLSGFPTTGNTLSPYGFVAFDRDDTPGIDTLYVADDRTGGSGGVQRWRLVNTTWTLEGTISTGNTSGARGLVGYETGDDIILIATTAEAGATLTRLVSFVDTGVSPSTITTKVLMTAASQTAYRGVALAPVP